MIERRVVRRRRTVGFLVLIGSSLQLAGCDQSQPTDVGSAADQADAQARPAWVIGAAGERFVAADLSDDPAMQEAIAEARRTMASARQQWRDTPTEQRWRWAVKWAAPVQSDGNADSAGDGGEKSQGPDGAVEYLWVRPLHWSPFRIEGRLLSEPRHPLIESPSAGDLVAFPAEQLVDWVKQPAEPGGPRRGGFTLEVLERRFGKPGS